MWRKIPGAKFAFEVDINRPTILSVRLDIEPPIGEQIQNLLEGSPMPIFSMQSTSWEVEIPEGKAIGRITLPDFDGMRFSLAQEGKLVF